MGLPNTGASLAYPKVAPDCGTETSLLYADFTLISKGFLCSSSKYIYMDNQVLKVPALPDLGVYDIRNLPMFLRASYM